MTYYAIQAEITGYERGWRRHHSVPTFYLHSNVQGILDEANATRVARDLIQGIQSTSGWTGASFEGLTITAVEQHD